MSGRIASANDIEDATRGPKVLRVLRAASQFRRDLLQFNQSTRIVRFTEQPADRNFQAACNGSNLVVHEVAVSVLNARLSTNVALRVGGNTFNGTQIIANGSVGIGTNNPAAQLEVGGDINSNAKSVPVAEEKLRIIRGTVAADGSVLDGNGFTVNFTHGGIYNIVYDKGFSGTGTLVATPTNSVADVTFGLQPSGQNCIVNVYQNGGSSGVGFSFIVIGPR